MYIQIPPGEGLRKRAGGGLLTPPNPPTHNCWPEQETGTISHE
jgi:hypothetical protein